MKIKSVLLLVTIIFLVSCGKSKINGEIFIVTKGAGNYKLGAVNVKIFKKSNADRLSANEIQFLKPDYRATR